MRLAALLTILALVAPAGAQTFTVVSSAPADHAANVPTATSIALTFSAPVSATAAPVLATFPTGAVTLGTPARSADGRTLTYPATLPPAARVVVLVLGATAEAGGGLTTPFALNLNTGTSNGPLTVRGSITGTGGVVPGGSIVALVTGDLAAGTIEIVAADVVEGAAASLPYALGPVAFGLYSAGAVRLPLGSTAGGAGYGLYDPDGDGAPNPILGTTGINITVAQPPPRTAADGFADVQATADAAVPGNARLVEVDPSVVDAAGASPVWTYRFQEEGTAQEVRVARLGLFTLPVPLATDRPFDTFVRIDVADSDAALAAAEADGGAAFQAAHAGQTVVVTAAALPGFFDTLAVWEIVYTASGGDVFTRRVVYGVNAGEPGPAAAVRLALRSANPARDGVTVALSLDAPGPVRVSVLDARGRLVARLLDGPLRAGEASLRWTPAPGVAAGVYRVVAEAAGGTSSVAVTVVR